MPKAIPFIIVAFVALLFGPDAAHAGYLDPGSGSTLVQGIIALLVGLKRFFARIFQPFSSNKD